MKSLLKLVPWFFVALFATEILVVSLPKKDGEFHVREFGRLPVLLNGRIQPFDSVARNTLLQIRSTGDVPLEQVPSWKFWHHPKKLKATEWLLEVMARPEVADTRPIFLIHHADLLGELKLQDKGVENSGLRYYTFNELQPVIPVIEEQGQKAGAVKEEAQRTTFQKQVLKLSNAVMLYRRLKYTLGPEEVDGFANEVAQFRNDLGPARVAAGAEREKADFDAAAIQKIALPVRHFQAMAALGYPLTVPPLEPGEPRDHWVNLGNALLDSARADTVPAPVTQFLAMGTAYRANDAEQFNRAVADYKDWLSVNFQKEVKKGRAEFFYNDVKAFLHAAIIYVCAFVLAFVGLMSLNLVPSVSEAFRRSAFYLILLAWMVHTFGLIFRMVLEGRPPVTNLYSSAIFIGWGAVVLGILLERIYRIGIGNIVASFAGFVTLLIAHNLALDGDTMEMLRAVLDTNFWLATHVVVVTLGYASTFVAGLLAIVYICIGLLTPLLTQKLAPAGGSSSSASQKKSQTEIGKALAKMVYGIICFATLFSFVGTVLGGIWADQSWGRFWGWDPKENGALLIVLWNAIMLHARWGGLVRERGLMNLAVFGNIVTSFSWFGVNMLGIGLHSYGFMDAAFKWLMLFVGSQVVIILLGLLPLRFWRSFRKNAPGSQDGGGSTRALAPSPA